MNDPSNDPNKLVIRSAKVTSCQSERPVSHDFGATCLHTSTRLITAFGARAARRGTYFFAPFLSEKGTR